MKALTLHQPWATAIAHAGKTIENRGWSTDYRGPLAIHAASRQPDPDTVAWFYARHAMPAAPLPTGVIVAVADLTDVHHATDTACSCDPTWAEPGAWHWALADVTALDKPIPHRGAMRLWTPTVALPTNH
ncbi:ASCH domain-containing protein [Stackebrandtia soli]|uniref:ASCH domain-containing protein n=1 Tax=Stackebrandtia soli TaxID=1892856 RepID=UPI0039E74779